MSNDYGIVTTNMNPDGNNENMNEPRKIEEEICSCSAGNSFFNQLIIDETSIYEYDYECLNKKQKEL